MATAEAATHVAAATETATHMPAAEATTVAAATPAEAATTSSATAARQRIGAQAPGESGGRSKYDHDLTQHCRCSFRRERVCSTENFITTVRLMTPNRSMTTAQDVILILRVGMRIIAGQLNAIAWGPLQRLSLIASVRVRTVESARRALDAISRC
jgi:hypothetical protein